MRKFSISFMKKRSTIFEEPSNWRRKRHVPRLREEVERDKLMKEERFRAMNEARAKKVARSCNRLKLIIAVRNREKENI